MSSYLCYLKSETPDQGVLIEAPNESEAKRMFSLSSGYSVADIEAINWSDVMSSLY